MKKNIIDERKLRSVIRQHILEQVNIEKDSEKKQRCVSGNVIPLNDIVGPSDSFSSYAKNLTKRDGGIHGMTDTLDMLRTLRLHPDINDGGVFINFIPVNVIVLMVGGVVIGICSTLLLFKDKKSIKSLLS